MLSGIKTFLNDAEAIKENISERVGDDELLVRETYKKIISLYNYLPENEKAAVLKLKSFLEYVNSKFPEITDRDFIVVEIVSKQLSSAMKGKRWQTFKESFKESFKLTFMFSIFSLILLSFSEKSKSYISNGYMKMVNFIVEHILNMKTGIITNYHILISSQSSESNFKAILWIFFYLFLAYAVLSVIFTIISETVSVFKNRYKILNKGNIGKAFFFPYLMLILPILNVKDISSIVISVLVLFFFFTLFLYWHTAYRFLEAKVAKEIAEILDNVCLKEFEKRRIPK